MGLEPGANIDGYEIVELLGEGGMGTVYRARQLDYGRDVALKLIHGHLARDPAFEARFRSEMRIAISLHHPHIVPVHAAGEAAGNLYIAMGLVPGRNLADLIAERGAMDPAEAVAFVRQVSSALDEAHRKNVIHRDVKPANVLVDDRVSHAYLTDFGLARSLDESERLTATGHAAMTVPFASPEQIEGKTLDKRSDIHSLGCLLFTCLTGENAFAGDTPTSMMFAKVNGKRTPRLAERGLPPALNPVLDRALATAPEERFESAGDFAAAAVSALEQAGATVPPAPPPPPPPPPADAAEPLPRVAARERTAPTAVARPHSPSRRRWAWVGAFGILAAVAAAMFLLLGSGGDEPNGGTSESAASSGAVTSAQAGPEPAPPPGGPGGQVFADQACGACHTLAVAQSIGTLGPNLDRALPGKSPGEILTDIVDPEADVARGFSAGIMPQDFADHIDGQGLETLVNFLSTCAGIDADSRDDPTFEKNGSCS